MLNSSAVLNGQPAILAWSVTSIQLPPKTIQACPINQPVRYIAIPEPTPISAFPHLPLPLLSLSLSLSLSFIPSSLNIKPLSVPILSVRASFYLSTPPQPPPSFLADCPFHVQPRPHTLFPSVPANLIPLARQSSTSRIDNFFSSLSNPCLGACPLNESPPRRCTSSDVHNRETCDACHTSLALGVSEMPSLAFARAFFAVQRNHKVLDLTKGP